MILSIHDSVSPGIARPSALTDVPNCTTQITNHAPVLRSAFGEGGSLITFPPHVTQYSTNPMTETLSVYPQVRALDPQPSSRRNGKIARLPKETRDMINRMLDDGIPYHVIIDELGEAGESLNTQNLTNWKQGGYQDWLKNQALIDRMRAQTEFAMDLLRETGHADASLVTEACRLVA